MSLAETIKTKIEKAINPEYIEVINESHLHKGHAGDDGSGQSHFKLMVASKSFEGMSRLQIQRQIYTILSQEMQDNIHALSIEAKISQE